MENISEITVIDYLFLIFYFGILITVTIFKRNEIWKGVCGGNGIPQPDEYIKVPAFLGMVFEIAQVIMLHRKPDIEMLVFLGGIIGIAGIMARYKIKDKLKHKE